jgi:IS5 family transposase
VAHRLIGQERFGVAGHAQPASSLDELGKLVDWGPVAALLDPLYSAPKASLPGRCWRCSRHCFFRSGTICPTCSWPRRSPIVLPSVVFVDFLPTKRRRSELPSSDIAVNRSRTTLIALFEIVTAQVKSKAVTAKTGTLVDATIIASASQDDDDALSQTQGKAGGLWLQGPRRGRCRYGVGRRGVGHVCKHQ